MDRQHTIPWNKVGSVPSILHTLGVNWKSRSKINTAYTGKCDVALNNIFNISFNVMKENNLLFSLEGSETDTARIHDGMYINACDFG